MKLHALEADRDGGAAVSAGHGVPLHTEDKW